ncbi:CapA family protein [Pseudobutyrivibrio sp. YE44]|uniref:CapA family protein n=1 Tax=Pseudobutyrivibrio sp. YE44 TaxID=1520802 RepID=UPI0015A2C2AA|nr:CapA family protein [Pseudobutyrivibrio sp. YE44]
MRKCKYFAAILLSSVLLFIGCGKSFSAIEITTKNEPVPQRIVIDDLADAWDNILNNSTKNFIGSHPVDESFLAMVTAEYGEDVIQEIASYANFETPEIWYQLTGKSIHVLWYDYCIESGIQNYAYDKTYVIDDDIDGDIVMDFTGDLSLAEGVATTTFMDHQKNGIEDCFSEQLLREMRSADILMINNEFAFTNRGAALPDKAYTFRADPSRINLLRKLGTDVVSVANNHVYDYGETGFLDTLDTLENDGMPYMGAGRNIYDAMEPVYFIIDGRKIAICSATQIERTLNFTKEATNNEAGVLKCLHPEFFCEEIKEAKRNADYVIVFPHWGTEGSANYGADQSSLARAFVEAGADVIIGGHTHCLETVEYMDNVPIYYSLGNYWFSITGTMPSDYDTGLAQIRISKEGDIEAYFLPCYFSEGVTSLLNEKDKAYSDIINDLNNLSSTAKIDTQGHIIKK